MEQSNVPMEIEPHDEEWEVLEEKATTVLVEILGTGLEGENLSNHTALQFLGLETTEPLLQVGRQVFTGQYEDVTGTALLFEKIDAPEPSDSIFGFSDPKILEFSEKTNKKLLMKRVFVSSNEANSAAAAEVDPAKDK